jgi:IPT/TIG domain-containing protein/Ig-like domain-containing protein
LLTRPVGRPSYKLIVWYKCILYQGASCSLRGPLQLFLLSAALAVGLVACAGGPGAPAAATVTPAAPSITGLNPNSGAVGTSVTITGTNFGTTQGTSTVTFSGTVATPTSWSATNIVVPVPTGATTGSVVVTVGGVASNGASFTVNSPPTITTQPANQTVTAGQAATFRVTANGTPPLSYQWQKNGVVITGVTTASYTTPPTTTADNGSTFQVVVNNVAGTATSGSATLTVTAPTLVQHVSGSNTRNNAFLSPFCYFYQLPGLTTAGNSVVVGFTFKNQPTPTVTDDKGDSYTIAENFFDITDGQSVGIAVAFNVVAGARVINLCFSSDPGGNVQPMATELDNVVGLDAVNRAGVGSNGTGTSIMAGSLIPSVTGDLVYQVAASLFGTLNQSSFTAGSQPNITWNLLSADLMDGWAGQYGLYNSTSAINPTMSMGTNQKWVSAAILLKSGNSGGVPSGMRIVHLEHENIPFHTSSGGTGFPFPTPLNLQFPCSGNLLVAMIGGGNASETVTSMIDTNLNTWAQAGATQMINGNDTVQAYYAGNVASSSNLGLTLNWTGGFGDFTIFFYDVAGAASSPLDTTAGNIGTQTVAGNLTMPFTIPPATPNEIVFAEVIWDSNTGTGLLGQLFDTNTFSGESLSGPEPVDENNGWGHLTTTTTAPIGFTWTALPIGLPVGSWAGMAVAFKAGP